MAPSAQSALTGAAVLALLVAAIVDVRSRLIPNGLVAAVAAAGLVIRGLENGVGALLSLAVSLVLLLGLAAAARRNLVGGGDAKMTAAVSLLVPPDRVLDLLLAISLAGAALAVAWLIARLGLAACRRRRDPPRVPALQLRQALERVELPYGVALFAGAVLTVFWT